MFQLKLRLAQLKVMQPANSLPTNAEHTVPIPSISEDSSQPAGASKSSDTSMPASGLHDDEAEELDLGFRKNASGGLDIVPAALCDGKSDTGNRKLRARFGRRRTHNEELCVASCGIVLGRATFFGSEALNGVRVCQLLDHFLQIILTIP